MIEITLDTDKCKMEGASDELLDLINYECSFEIEGAEHDLRFKRGQWDGRRKLFNKRYKTFQYGLWSRIEDILKREVLDGYTVKDLRSKRVPTEFKWKLTEAVEFRDYQVKATNAAIKAEASVIQVATGGGKTVIAAIIMSELKCQTLFLVHTKDLLYQAKGSFENFFEGVKIGQIGDGVVDIQPITVATMQTVSKFLNVEYVSYKYDDEPTYKDDTDTDGHEKTIKKLLKDTDLLIWDEVHRVACDTAFEISEKMAARYRVGLSASPWRDDGADMMIEAAMGQVSYKISASDLIDMGYLVPPVIRRVKVPSTFMWEIDKRPYDTIYKEEIVNNHYRNTLIAKYVQQFMELGVTTLVLVQQIQHGNKIKKLISETFHPIDFISGRDFSQKRLQAIQGMRDGEIQAMIASTIADEGLDIKRLTALIMAGGGKSSTRALQRVGRVLRPFEDKTHALVIDFADEAKYLRKHADKRLEIYKTEPRFEILEF